MSERRRNDHLRKVCPCAPSKWVRCKHPWHLNFTHRGKIYRFSLDRQLGRPVVGKSAAEVERDKIIPAIRAGTFLLASEPLPDPGPADSSGAPALPRLALKQLFSRYRESHVLRERPASEPRWTKQTDLIGRQVLQLPTGEDRAFGDWLIADITTHTIKRFQEVRREAGIYASNRDLGVLRAVFNWAIREGLAEQTPFRRHGVALIQRGRERARDRRLEPGESDRLLATCGPDLRALVEAAIETGCRRGELLSAQWKQVRLDGPRPVLMLPASKTKTGRPREIPISARLAAILKMRRTDPKGNDHKPDQFVFGNAIGEPLGSFKRAWATAVLRAHGVKPRYIKGTAKLTPESRAALRRINLHVHDLRREAGSRWLDAGIPLHTIQRWLGHTNIKQTSTYLAVTDTGSHDAMVKFDVLRGLHVFASDDRTGHQTTTNGTENPKPKTQENTENQTAVM